MAGNPVLTQAQCLVPSGDRCGEGILWHAPSEAIYWTDINRFLVHRYILSKRTVESWFFDEPVTAVVETREDSILLIVLGSGPILWSPETDRRKRLGFSLPGWPHVRLNDAAVDPRGSLWAGSMRNNVAPDGSSLEACGTDGILFRIDPDGVVREYLRDICISNTLVWSPDHATFYFADSLRNRIRAYDFDISSGEIANEREFFEGFSRGAPDGSAIDSEGFIWNCRYGGGCVVRIDPSGSVDRILEVPTANPTMCAFGGPELKTLYITTAGADTGPGDRLAGGVFAAELNIQGLARNRFILSEANLSALKAG